MKSTFALLVVIGSMIFISAPAEAQTLTVLHSFNGAEGSYPIGDLTLSGSTLYGVTQGDSGTHNYGTVFSIPVSGGTPTTLFTFNMSYTGQSPHGTNPVGGLTLSGSTLYGMTEYGGTNGGTNGDGTIFSIPTSGGTPTTLFIFDGTHGRNPIWAV